MNHLATRHPLLVDLVTLACQVSTVKDRYTIQTANH